MAGVQSIEQLQAMLRAHGVRTAYVKALAPKQDNEKNQIVLGGGLVACPFGVIRFQC